MTYEAKTRVPTLGQEARVEAATTLQRTYVRHQLPTNPTPEAGNKPKPASNERPFAGSLPLSRRQQRSSLSTDGSPPHTTSVNTTRTLDLGGREEVKQNGAIR
jgi:hypothetical protein